jgi:hypothetical protein
MVHLLVAISSGRDESTHLNIDPDPFSNAERLIAPLKTPLPDDGVCGGLRIG